MDAKAKALAQLQHWNQNGYTSTAKGGQWGYVDAPRYAPKAPQRGKGGPLSSIISELSGAGGAAGGAAAGAGIGSFVGPVGTLVGGLIGAGIGGFGGGTVGRGVENKVRDNQNFFGKGGSAKSAFGEGALAGALSLAAPGIGAAAKGVRGAVKGRGAIEQLAKESGTVLEAAPKVGVLQGAGQQLKAGAGGYGIGTRLGSNRLTAKESERVASSLRELGVKPSSPENMSRVLGSKASDLEKILNTQYTSANSAVSKSELTSLRDRITSRISSEVGEPDSKFVASRLGELGKGKDLNGVWGFNKNLGKFTNYGANAEGKLVDREAAARIMKDETRKFLNAKVPGVKKTNELYHGAKDAESLAVGNAADLKSGGLSSKVFSLSPVRAAEAKLGSSIEGAGKLSAGTGGALSKVTQQAKFQAPADLAKAITGASEPPIDPQASLDGVAQTNPDGSYQATDPSNTQDSFNLNDPTTQQVPTAPVTLQEALQQAQQLLGNQEKPATYLSYAKEIMSQSQGGGSGGPNITKVTAQQYGLAQGGNQALQSLGQLLQSNPSVLNKTATPGRKLPIVGGFISNRAGTGDFDAIGYNIADSILRLRTGAAANASEVKNLQAQIMPRAGDSPKTVQTKLRQIQQIFGGVLNTANGGAGSGTSSQELQGAY